MSIIVTLIVIGGLCAWYQYANRLHQEVNLIIAALEARQGYRVSAEDKRILLSMSGVERRLAIRTLMETA